MEDGIGTLYGYSFVVRRGNEEVCDVHKLVHLAARVWVRQYSDAKGVTEESISNMVSISHRTTIGNRAV